MAQERYRFKVHHEPGGGAFNKDSQNCELEVSLARRTSFRTARATRRHPVFGKAGRKTTVVV